MERLEKQRYAHIKKFQEEALLQLLSYVQNHSAFYQHHFSKYQIDINKISLGNLASIPPTTKDDLQARTADFLCVPRNLIAEYCSTSGTLGKPVTVGLTANDLERLAYNEQLSFESIGCTADDIFQLMLTMDKQFMAGIAYYNGIRKLGAGVIRIGPGSIPMHIDSILQNLPTVLIAVPSFILKLIAYSKEKNIELNNTSVKKILCIGEPIRDANNTFNELAQQITSQWNVSLYSTYASTEKQTAFTECTLHNGSHAHPELLIFEILDENNQPLPPGEFGELAITTLGVEGMPLIRYKTGDICTYFAEPCPCSRNSHRISQVVGRKQHLIKYKGTTLYPPAIYNALNSINEISDYFVQAARSEIGTDDLQVYIALKNKNENISEKIKQALQSSLRVLPDIFYVSIEEIVQMQSLQSDRKLNKFRDNR